MMTEEKKPDEGNLAEELRKLGDNLSEALRVAWESPERKRLQEELSTGLSELGENLKSEIRDFSESQTGQRLRSDAEDLRQRVRSGEVESKVREELVNALKIANSQLQTAIEKMWPERTAGVQGETSQADSARSGAQGPVPNKESGLPQGGGQHEVHPDDVE